MITWDYLFIKYWGDWSIYIQLVYYIEIWYHLNKYQKKPRNLLLNRSCDVKICDFGLGRAIAENILNNIMMTYYVETRWYRAPELLIGY